MTSNKLEKLLHLLVDSVESMMMHGLANLKLSLISLRKLLSNTLRSLQVAIQGQELVPPAVTFHCLALLTVVFITYCSQFPSEELFCQAST